MIELSETDKQILMDHYGATDILIVISRNQWDNIFKNSKYKNSFDGAGIYLHYLDEDGDYSKYWINEWKRLSYEEILGELMFVNRVFKEIRTLEYIRNIIKKETKND